MSKCTLINNLKAVQLFKLFPLCLNLKFKMEAPPAAFDLVAGKEETSTKLASCHNSFQAVENQKNMMSSNLKISSNQKKTRRPTPDKLRTDFPGLLRNEYRGAVALNCYDSVYDKGAMKKEEQERCMFDFFHGKKSKYIFLLPATQRYYDSL